MVKALLTWLGDCVVPGRLGNWLLRLGDDSEEEWVDAEGRRLGL